MHLGMPVVPDEYITKRGWLKGTCSNFISEPSCPLMKSSKKTLQQEEKWSSLFDWWPLLTDQFGIPDISISLVPQNGKRTTFFKSGSPAHTHTAQSHNHDFTHACHLHACYYTGQLFHVVMDLGIVANCLH